MDLSVITVTWNSEDRIIDQMQSVISGCQNISYEQIVVDNNSSDQTVSEIKKRFPHVSLIENKTNAGFGAANNQGAAIAQGRYLLFLNPDMRVEEGSLDAIVEWMDQHKDIGLASCKLTTADKNINADASPRRFPNVFDQCALILKLPHLFPSLMNRYLMKDFDFEKEQEVDSVRGAFFLMKREVYEILGWAFDPRYYFWFEDVDTCREVKKMGFKVMYVPIISCVDYVGQSVKKRTSFWKQNQFTKSMLIYFQKWEPWYKWIWIAAVRPVGIILAYLHSKVSK